MCRPYGGQRETRKTPRSVGSESPGAAVEPQYIQFCTHPGPQWARKERNHAHRFLSAGRSPPCQRGVPRKWGSRGCVAWRREALPNRRLHTSPSAFLVSFWASKKKLAAGAAKYPAKRERMARRVVAPYKSASKESREKRGRAATWGRPYNNRETQKSGAVRTPPPTKVGNSFVP